MCEGVALWDEFGGKFRQSIFVSSSWELGYNKAILWDVYFLRNAASVGVTHGAATDSYVFDVQRSMLNSIRLSRYLLLTS